MIKSVVFNVRGMFWTDIHEKIVRIVRIADACMYEMKGTVR